MTTTDNIAPKAARLVAETIADDVVLNSIVEDVLDCSSCAATSRLVEALTPLIASQYAEVMGCLRDALDTAGDDHADTCAMNNQTGSDSVVRDCDCWVSRAQKIVGGG